MSLGKYYEDICEQRIEWLMRRDYRSWDTEGIEIVKRVEELKRKAELRIKTTEESKRVEETNRNEKNSYYARVSCSLKYRINLSLTAMQVENEAVRGMISVIRDEMEKILRDIQKETEKQEGLPESYEMNETERMELKKIMIAQITDKVITRIDSETGIPSDEISMVIRDLNRLAQWYYSDITFGNLPICSENNDSLKRLVSEIFCKDTEVCRFCGQLTAVSCRYCFNCGMEAI